MPRRAVLLTVGSVRVSGGPSSGTTKRRVHVELVTGDYLTGHARTIYLRSRGKTDVAIQEITSEKTICVRSI